MFDRHYSLNLKPWSARTLLFTHKKYSVGLQEMFVSRLCSQEENSFFPPWACELTLVSFSVTCVKKHKLLQVCKQVVTNLFTSCRQIVFALLVPSCCINKFGQLVDGSLVDLLQDVRFLCV